MTFARKRIGESGESLACHFLVQKGMKIVGTNVRMKLGEIDILAMDGNVLVGVEVKTKTSDDFGIAEEMVGTRKSQKLRQLMRELSVEYPDKQLRIDVVAINNFGQNPEINYIENAVEG